MIKPPPTSGPLIADSTGSAEMSPPPIPAKAPLGSYGRNPVPNPTRSDIAGVAVALTILVAWATLFCFALTRTTLSLGVYLLILPLLTFLYVGLFITGHDAMHGLVSPKHPLINAMIGRLAVWCYALFDYKKLLVEHWKHHSTPGEPLSDPDFHDGTHKSFIGWYLHFMWHYTSIWQLVRIACAVQLLVCLGGISETRIMLAFGIPGLLSSLQLFYFGTYLPHRESSEPFVDRHNARSNRYPVWLSFVTCYHFGYHLEHHRYPKVPWWALPQVRL